MVNNLIIIFKNEDKRYIINKKKKCWREKIDESGEDKYVIDSGGKCHIKIILK